MKPFLSLALMLALFDATSQAQTKVTAPPEKNPALTVSDASSFKNAQDLMRVDMLWSKPIDWKEKSSSTADIVAHLRQALDQDVLLEIRGQDANRSTFELPQAPLGPTLSSVAALANAKVWAFPGRLVIAPETLLTDEEKASIKARMGGEWKESSTAGGGRWNAYDQLQQIALTLVGTDLKERFAARGLTPRLPPPPSTGESRIGNSVYTTGRTFVAPPLPYELPLSELSPASKNILQSLLDAQSQRTQAFRMSLPSNVHIPPEGMPVLDASTIVSFDDLQGSQMQLALQKVDAQDPQKRADISRWYASKPQLLSA